MGALDEYYIKVLYYFKNFFEINKDKHDTPYHTKRWLAMSYMITISKKNLLLIFY